MNKKTAGEIRRESAEADERVSKRARAAVGNHVTIVLQSAGSVVPTVKLRVLVIEADEGGDLLVRIVGAGDDVWVDVADIVED